MISEYHEAANIFPMMSDAEIQDLADDIKVNGLHVPIETINGKIIDGRNRWEACKQAGIEPEQVEVDPASPVEYVMSLNLHRRHLTDAQKAMVAAKAKPLFEAEAKERQGTRTDLKDNCPESSKGQSRDKAGAMMGVSGKSVDRAAKVIAKGSKELVVACERGDVAVSAASKVAELPKAEQDNIIMTARAEGRSVRVAVSKAAKAFDAKSLRQGNEPPRSVSREDDARQPEADSNIAATDDEPRETSQSETPPDESADETLEASTATESEPTCESASLTLVDQCKALLEMAECLAAESDGHDRDQKILSRFRDAAQAIADVVSEQLDEMSCQHDHGQAVPP